jgi:hypothetical protein
MRFTADQTRHPAGELRLTGRRSIAERHWQLLIDMPDVTNIADQASRHTCGYPRPRWVTCQEADGRAGYDGQLQARSLDGSAAALLRE